MLEFILAFLFLPIPEYATSQEYSAYTLVPPKAPIRIDACEASVEKNRGLIANSTLEYGTAFTILGDKPALRVRIRYAFDDRSWHTVHVSETTMSGTFSPGTKISRTRRYGGNYKERGVAKDAVAVVCSPEEIDFSDGSVWHEPAAPVTTSPLPDPD